MINISLPRWQEPYESNDPWGALWLSLPVANMPALVAEYVKAIEIEQTNKFCKCEWIVHPDDTHLAEGARRIRKGEAAPDCWVHTKEGFLLGFFDWLFKVREKPTGQPLGILNNPAQQQ